MIPLHRNLWKRSTSAPGWARDLVARVWREYGRGAVPKLAFVEGGGGVFEGRWFPIERGIAVREHPDQQLEKVVLLHELAHAIVAQHSPNKIGRHDGHFYEIAAILYTRYRANKSYAPQVDNGRVEWRP